MRLWVWIAFLAKVSLCEETGSGSTSEVRWCRDPGRQRVLCRDRCLTDSGTCLTQFTYTKCSCLGYETSATEVVAYSMRSGEPEAKLTFARYAEKCEPCTDYCGHDSHERNKMFPVRETILKLADQTCVRKRKRKRKRQPSLGRRRSRTGSFGRRTLKIPSMNIFRQLSEEKIPTEPKYERSPMEMGSACPTPGNMTQICVERCAEDGVTCDAEIELDMCTCKGSSLSTRETIQFDMESGRELVIKSPFSSPRFVRICGDCLEYCEWFPGETQKWNVQTEYMSCDVQANGRK